MKGTCSIFSIYGCQGAQNVFSMTHLKLEQIKGNSMASINNHGGKRNGSGRLKGSDKLIYDEARAKREVARADLMQLKAELKRESLIPREQIEQEYAVILKKIQLEMLAMPAYLAPLLANKSAREFEQIMLVELKKAINRIAA